MNLNRWIVCSFLASGVLTGCEAVDSASYIAVSFPTQPVQVDVSCDGTDCVGSSLDVAVDWTRDPTELASDAEIDLYEYKIEYAFTGIDVEIPYFAALSPQFIIDGGEIEFTVAPMGSDQRETLAPYVVGDAVVSGTATLTFAGWDELDQPLQTNPATFNIWAANGAVATTTTTGATATTP